MLTQYNSLLANKLKQAMSKVIAVLLCQRTVKDYQKNSVFLMLQMMIFIYCYLYLIWHVPTVAGKIYPLFIVIVLANLILLLLGKIRYFSAYNNAFMVALWGTMICFLMQAALLQSISGYLFNNTLIYNWAWYFLALSVLISLWGTMMIICIVAVYSTCDTSSELPPN